MILFMEISKNRKRTASAKVLKDEACNIAKNPKNDGYQNGLALLLWF